MTGKLIVIAAISIAAVFGMFCLGRLMDGSGAGPRTEGGGAQ